MGCTEKPSALFPSRPSRDIHARKSGWNELPCAMIRSTISPLVSDSAPYILVVDDYPDGRDMLMEYLAFRGLTVVSAANGDEALTLAERRPPAIVLMDLSMPGIDGWEATRRLKAHPRTREAIVIAVTAHALAPDEGHALAAGADGFVAKPFDLQTLGNALVAIMQKGRPALKLLATANAPRGA